MVAQGDVSFSVYNINVILCNGYVTFEVWMISKSYQCCIGSLDRFPMTLEPLVTCVVVSLKMLPKINSHSFIPRIPHSLQPVMVERVDDDKVWLKTWLPLTNYCIKVYFFNSFIMFCPFDCCFDSQYFTFITRSQFSEH